MKWLWFSVLALSGSLSAETLWNQFRGPNGQGVAADATLPADFGPEPSAAWKIELPPGHSSPVIWQDLIFLTAHDPATSKELSTLAIDRNTGASKWQQRVTSTTTGDFHTLNNPAASTPAADAAHVYVYFGTYGLICYDHAGHLVWEEKISAPKSKYGMATSPVLYQDSVILVLDDDGGGSRMIAFQKDTGAHLWVQPRPLFKSGWSTPMIWQEQLIVLGSKRLTAYHPATGEEKWWAGGFSPETVGVPVMGEGLLFAGTSALGGRGDEAFDATLTWNTTLQEFDRNHDGQIQREEMTEGFGFIQRPELPKDNPGYKMPIKDVEKLLKMFDRDHDNIVTAAEWLVGVAAFINISHPSLVALRPGAQDDARPAHVAWELQRGLPETPSLLYLLGNLYLLRDGGLLTCLTAATGQEIYRERLPAPGQYIASPIAAGDKILTASVNGVVCILQAGSLLKVLSTHDFKAPIYATPALSGNHLYLRTEHHLWALMAPPRE